MCCVPRLIRGLRTPPPTTCAHHVIRSSVSASCALYLPPAAHSQAIPSFPRRPLSSAARSRCLQLLSARSRLSSALAGCRITTSCDAAASHPSALLPLVCAAPHPPAPRIISMHHYQATPASIAPGCRIFKCFNFVSLKSGTGARHRGQIAPSQDVSSLPTVCRG